MYKRQREEEEDGEITSTDIMDELNMLKDEVMFLRDEKNILARQLNDASEQRDKYRTQLDKRKERTQKWKEDLEDESHESLRSDYSELKYTYEAKKEKWKAERNKLEDRVERLEVKIEALKEENGKLVIMETRLRGDFERRILSSTSENRYKDQIKQLEDSLKHSEVAFRAADALQKEQEAATESMRANVRQIEDTMRLKDDKISALQMAASRAAQQLADASNALDLAAHQKATLEKNLTIANNKFHEQIKVDAQKITSLQNEINDKNRILSEQKNNALHAIGKLQMLENNEQVMQDELVNAGNKLVFADDQIRMLQTENVAMKQQLAFQSGGPPDVLLATIEGLKVQNFNLMSELQRLRAFAQEFDVERSQMLEEIQLLRQGKGMTTHNGTGRGTFVSMQKRIAQLGSALGIPGPNSGPNSATHGPNGSYHGPNYVNSPPTNSNYGPKSPPADFLPTPPPPSDPFTNDNSGPRQSSPTNESRSSPSSSKSPPLSLPRETTEGPNTTEATS